MKKVISTFMLVSLMSIVSNAAGYDIEFLHNENNSSYTIIISDDYGKRVKVPVSQEEMTKLIENPTVIDSRTHKPRQYMDMFVESVKNHASQTLF